MPAEPSAAPNPGQIAEIASLRVWEQAKAGSLCVCEPMARNLELLWGWSAAFGYYAGPEVNRRYGHWWNLLPDGTIVDSTADQFDSSATRVIPPGDARQRWYRQMNEDGHPVATPAVAP